MSFEQDFATEIEKAGGRVFYVGGYVRDTLMGKPCNDRDVEAYDVPKEQIKEIASQVAGKPLDEVGSPFGVMTVDGVDIAIPRREVKTGGEHKDFAITEDPFVSYEEACKRRDLTINAILMDVKTGEMVDPYGGAADIKNHMLRCVNPDTFVEDPLRALRTTGFAARL